MLENPRDVAVLVQDYPLEGLDESKDSYLNDAREFIAAMRAAGVPAAVCSTLPENIDRSTREMLVAAGVAPMQGIRETLDAIAGAVRHGRRRQRMRDEARAAGVEAGAMPPIGAGCALGTEAEAGDRVEAEAGAVARLAGTGPVTSVDEYRAKRWLHGVGIPIPAGCVTGAREAPEAAAGIGFPVAVKLVNEHLPHKTEVGAVALGISSPAEVEAAVARIRTGVRRFDADASTDRFLVERMVGPPLAELLVGVRTDPRFGLAMTLASGGVLTELVADAVTILLPASRADLEEALGRLRMSRVLDGFRGAAPANRAVIVDALSRLASRLCREANDVVEVEVNPLFVLTDRVCAVDALMRVRGE